MIAQTIQLALAPVFVLVAIGNIMNLLSTRLGRIVDRSRELQKQHVATSGAEHDAVVIEMRAIATRIHLITRAIFLMVLSGLTIGVTVAVLFLACLFIAPLAGVVPAYATAPALFFVACLMLRDLTELDWDDTTEVIPAAVTALVMPFTYSIANGLAFGFITYAVLKLFTGKAKDVHKMVWAIGGVFLFKFVYIGGH